MNPNDVLKPIAEEFPRIIHTPSRGGPTRVGHQAMSKPVSPKPESFASAKERDYWHMAQDTAFRAGASLIEENGSTWLVFGDERQLIVRPENADHIWYETWRALHYRYEGLSRLWVGGRPLEP